MYRVFVFLLLLVACTHSSETEKDTNHLLTSSSPYLREHADNPVHWHEWGQEALDRAKREDKPVIVSIGYAACHWCHVMERESFMDSAVARIMNENFISIKIDREERPDIDQQYVHASEVLTGSAGWPLNAFAMPDGRAFHVATYYPKDTWIRLLDQVSKAWKEKRNDLDKQADAIAKNVDQLNKGLFSSDTTLRFDIPAFLNHVKSWNTQLDLNNGGLKGNMKFPMPSLCEFMLQHAWLTNDKQSMQWVTTTLDNMMHGGIYDQLGGGFSRYTVDSLWHIPHFEKMLYDNAQLVSLYSHAFKVTKNREYERVIKETLAFIEREMMSPEGTFYASINADSEGEEGKFYKWDQDLSEYYNVYDGVLNWKKEVPTEIRNKLVETRDQRVHPSVDKKVITSWNAMMIVGFVDAYTATNDRHYLDVALKTARAVDSTTVVHVKGVDAFLEDYAWLAKAYLHLYQVTFDLRWLDKAEDLSHVAYEKFKQLGSPLLYYSHNEIVEFFDNVIPSSNSVFAEDLLILADYLQDTLYLGMATGAIQQAVSSIDIEGIHIANWARLAENLNFSPYEIAIVGNNAVAFAHELQQHSLPPCIFLGGDNEDLPLLENKLVKNKTMIYVCKNRTCKLPVDDPKKALEQIRR
jgi:uncharacterized protein YyaL (SSP411 family)